jgi:hypothetical protein
MCKLAYWHRPYFNSGYSGGNPEMGPFWTTLYTYGVDLVLNGHAHDYERFQPMTSSGVVDNVRGIREIIVGTGGMSHTPIYSAAPNSVVRDDGTFGVLKLVLHRTGYDWQFVPEAGYSFTDSGSDTCHLQ